MKENYLKGEKWNGNGKEYDIYKNLKFESEYSQGKRWNGIVKEYDIVGQLIFEGYYLNGEKKVINRRNRDIYFI